MPKDKKQKKDPAKGKGEINDHKELRLEIEKVVKQFDGKLNNFDYNNFILDIDCPQDKEVECGTEVNKLIIAYTEIMEKEEKEEK